MRAGGASAAPTSGTSTARQPRRRRDRDRVQAGRAAAGDERGGGRVDALVDGDVHDRATMFSVASSSDGDRGLLERLCRAARRPRGERRARPPARSSAHRAAEKEIGVEEAEDERASVTVGWCRRGRSRPGPGTAPALSGRHGGGPPPSTQAIEPPPAPMLLTSTEGKPVMWP